MDSCFPGDTTTTDYSGATSITSVHSDIIHTHILTKLDGPTLASISSASSHLHSLCSHQILWKNICNSYWPSTTDPRIQTIVSTFPSGHRSFFSDSFPGPDHRHPGHRPKSHITKITTTPELISAVDVHFGDQLVYSKVVVTQSSTSWFMSSPLRIDLVGPKETVPTPVKFDGKDGEYMRLLEEEMKLSWIIIDPTRKRALNLSSRKPTEVRRHCLTGDIQVVYETVVAAQVKGGFVKHGVTVTCGREGGELHVREISAQMEDIEGKIVFGKDSLGILHEVMEGRRRKMEIQVEKKRVENFLGMRRSWRETKERRERRLDMVCMSIGVIIFMAFWTLILFS